MAQTGDLLARLQRQQAIDELLEDLNDVCEAWDAETCGLPLFDTTASPSPHEQLREAVRAWLTVHGRTEPMAPRPKAHDDPFYTDEELNRF